MKNKQIVFTKKNTAEFLETETREICENEVLVETLFSGISCGTEKANLMGDANLSVCAESAPAVFPRTVGYSSAGIVVAVGDKVKSVKAGDAVAMFWSAHQKYNILPENRVVPFDVQTVSMEDAALGHIATFPLAALRKTRLEIGESMLVMGLGILGLMAVRFSKTAGAAPVIAVDPVAKRREKALKFGADFALDPTEEGFSQKVKALTEGGANCAIEVTGLGEGLNQTLDCMAKFGRVALLGCTRDKNFTVDYYRKVHGPGIQLVGAHTNARPSHNSYPGYFTQRDELKCILKLCAMNRLSLSEMKDEVFLPEDCSKVYARLIEDKEFPVVSLFDWRNVE